MPNCCRKDANAAPERGCDGSEAAEAVPERLPGAATKAKLRFAALVPLAMASGSWPCCCCSCGWCCRCRCCS
eukprot:3321608-Alexandrium_andersonii.AAC.1